MRQISWSVNDGVGSKTLVQSWSSLDVNSNRCWRLMMDLM